MHSDSGSSSDDVLPARTDRARNRPAFVAATIAGAVLTVLVVLAIVALAARRDNRQLTEADYRAALARWEAEGPKSYELDLELTGNRPGKIHVEVRDGEVAHMTRDGVEPRQRRTWDYWSVPGQFDTIGEELEMARDPARSFNSPGATQVVQWAQFDPRYGYPQRYDRVVLGADFEVHWNITHFQALDASK